MLRANLAKEKRKREDPREELRPRLPGAVEGRGHRSYCTKQGDKGLQEKVRLDFVFLRKKDSIRDSLERVDIHRKDTQGPL